MSKRGILAVSFGTSYKETREKNIDVLECVIKESYPNYSVRRAFTSKMIINKLKKRDGIHTDTVSEALQRFYDDGFTHIDVVPTHIINGAEYERVVFDCRDSAEKFSKITIGRPLLSSTEDYFEIIDILNDEYDFDDGSSVVFMGHGSDHNGNSAYPALNFILNEKGFDNVHIATVEGYPALETVLDKLEKHGCKTVKLAPLMFVAGDHIQEDMLGDDEDSWKNILEKQGYRVRGFVKGLGELPKIRNLYLKHLKDAIEERELVIEGGI
ncbi:sirohydrochlorin cobaltochelatase [Alkalibacter mobilis]|uniref:sirohydrochlorin cobaltochelatase n=1 Tax=Alkalibacter mobilis TaxID=2787712 RepID=UPI00189C886A|nr:sirohydrochlorin cobaltochelatase [Alkalibacter mobilis]MBF7097170.1 sirohydrochlorin cobaltochelatase [Alkalibacter mobilis]